MLKIIILVSLIFGLILVKGNEKLFSIYLFNEVFKDFLLEEKFTLIVYSFILFFYWEY